MLSAQEGIPSPLGCLLPPLYSILGYDQEKTGGSDCDWVRYILLQWGVLNGLASQFKTPLPKVADEHVSIVNNLAVLPLDIRPG